MDRFPTIITAGGMLLGWIAGTMAVTDPAIVGYMPLASAMVEGQLPDVVAGVRYGAGVAGALLVLALGVLVKRRRAAAAA
jgi:predicted tellurium resistance membrane protein TerC